jgi:isopenicillin-N N-acyltransferase like protein
VRTLDFQGTPAEIGEAFGESCRDLIEELYDLRIRNALEQAWTYGGRRLEVRHLLALAKTCLPMVARFSPGGFEELEGIARGAGRSVAEIWAMNALTDIRDVLAHGDIAEGEGCSSFVIPAGAAADGMGVCGQTWDLATDNGPFVCLVRRRPREGLRTLAFTLVGCLSLIGMNERGLAIGTTNLRTQDARPGLSYLDLIHAVLGLADREEAVSQIRTAHRMAAHFYYLMDSSGAASRVECTALSSAAETLRDHPHVQANHVLEGRFRPIETVVADGSSLRRCGRLAELIRDPGHRGIESLKGALADHEDAPKSICRHGHMGVSTHGAVIMRPQDRMLWAVSGQPCSGTWTSHSV